MEIYLVRHTRVQTGPGICYGHLDVPLAETASHDIERTLTLLPRDPSIPVISSPLARCRTLAERISTRVCFDPNLRELHFGQWEGRPWSEIPRQELDTWGENFATEGPPGGESFADLRERTLLALASVHATGASKVICVTHGGVVRSFLCLALELPALKAFDFDVDYGSVTILKWAPGGRCKVSGVNRV
jgi:alpha-ribazole phosphatase